MKTQIVAIVFAVLVVGLQNVAAVTTSEAQTVNAPSDTPQVPVAQGTTSTGTTSTTSAAASSTEDSGSSSGSSQETCPSFKGGEEGGASMLVDAASTGSIDTASEHVHQSFDEECHSEEGRQYRTANGGCNHVFNLGTAKTPFKRVLPAEYSDGLSAPRSYGQNGALLPSAADVSWVLHSHKNAIDQLTTMFMQWGQFIDHDVTLTPWSSGKAKIKCCGVNHTYPDFMNHPQCYPIRLGRHDINKRFVGNCMEMTRSLPARDAHGHQITPREQLNEITSFVDASMVYGSSDAHMAKLREKTADGKLGERMRTSGANLLPKADVPMCILQPGHYCFVAGDARVNVQPGLIVMHTIFVRLHNIIADGLRDQRPDATPEEIFQEARKIVIAIVQMINYDEFLPTVLGDELMDLYHLRPGGKKGSGRIGYSASTDPRVTNAFATVAFRFGHSNIPEHLIVSGVTHKFRDLFFRPDLVFTDFDGVLESLMNTSRDARSQDSDRFMVDDVTGHMFEPKDQVKGQPSKGLDLAALNIQRGRDHGLPPFNKFRQFCGLAAIEDFDHFDTKLASKLKKLYNSVDDIDFFTGGLLETVSTRDASGKKLPIGKRPYVGPTFACIIAQQFHALKFGDRFYFETDRAIEGFTDGQLDAIRNVTLGKVSCVTSNLTQVPEDVFVASKKQTLDCSAVKKHFLDFSLWRE